MLDLSARESNFRAQCYHKYLNKSIRFRMQLTSSSNLYQDHLSSVAEVSLLVPALCLSFIIYVVLSVSLDYSTKHWKVVSTFKNIQQTHTGHQSWYTYTQFLSVPTEGCPCWSVGQEHNFLCNSCSPNENRNTVPVRPPWRETLWYRPAGLPWDPNATWQPPPWPSTSTLPPLPKEYYSWLR